MKVFKRGGFIILDDAGVEAPIPIPNFDYQIISDIVKIRDVAEQIGYSSLLVDLQDESGTPVGNAAAIAVYFGDLTAAGASIGDASATNQLTQIGIANSISSLIAVNLLKLDSIDAELVQVNLKTILVLTKLQEINVELEAINTDTDKLGAIETNTDRLAAIETNTDRLAAIETNTDRLAAIETNTAAIEANTDTSNYTKLLTQANDLVQAYTWLDGGTADQRVSTIIYSSTALALTVTETFSYILVSGSYLVASSTLS